MKEIVDFMFLAFFLGPLGSIPYGLKILSPVAVFLIITVLYITPIPLIFKLFELGGHHRRIYRMRIFRKASEVTGKRMEEMVAKGDRITDLFEKKMGHLGLYATIVLFTIVFGIFWASLFSYLLMVKKTRAIYSMALGVVIGNSFWVFFINYFREYITLEIIFIFLLIPLWIYGTQREIEVLRKVARRLNLMRNKPSTKN